MAEEIKMGLVKSEPSSAEELQLGSTKRPWWQNGLVVTVLGALAAAVAPVTVAIQENIHKNKELAIAEREQDFKMRMAFLDLAIDPARTPADRQVVLRFLQTATKDEALAGWARTELARVDGELDQLKLELKKKQDAIAAQTKAEESARSGLEKLHREKGADEKQVRELEGALSVASAHKVNALVEATQLQEQIQPGAQLKAQGEAAPSAGWGRGFGMAPQASAAPGGAGADRCAPGSVRALPAFGIPLELARAACEQALQAEPALTRKVGTLVFQAGYSLAGRQGTVSCFCRTASL